MDDYKKIDYIPEGHTRETTSYLEYGRFGDEHQLEPGEIANVQAVVGIVTYDGSKDGIWLMLDKESFGTLPDPEDSSKERDVYLLDSFTVAWLIKKLQHLDAIVEADES